MARYRCHDCDTTFAIDLGNDYGTYEFRRCPACGSGKTTLDRV
jgi:DNA-directed RNA polymerase subunit RPC12/RpoP